MKRLFISTLLLLFSLIIDAQVYQTGDSISSFSATNVNAHSDFKLSKVKEELIVLVFISNNCPFVEQYLPRIKKLDSIYTDVQFVFINTYSKSHLNENKHHMISFLKKHQLNNVYLKSHNHEIIKLFGVEKAPEVYLLSKINGVFHLAYKGAIDDNPQSVKDVKNDYLKNAIELVRRNKQQTSPASRPMGCRVY